MIRTLVSFWLACTLTAAASAADTPAVTVFAAASLAGVLQDADDEFEGNVTYSFGGSGVMARQVAAGAPADVVILANGDWMTWLQGQQSVRLEEVNILATNSLALIGPLDAAPLLPSAIPMRLGNARLAMGHRDAVPAGLYAQAWLRKAGLWDVLQTQLAETDNVRAALTLVARQETPLGIVYVTDAQAEPRVKALYLVPADSHPPIVYPAGALTHAGTAYLTHLQKDPRAVAAFAAHGFGPAPQ